MLSLYDNIYMEAKTTMKENLRIKDAAKERGITLNMLAGALGIHRCNMSAIAAGARGLSLKTLKAISSILDCGLDELVYTGINEAVFKDKKTQSLLDNIERRNYDGIDKTWVNSLMSAQRAHYLINRRLGNGAKKNL
jgi:DNA-binding Xre family transcriptional regulator